MKKNRKNFDHLYSICDKFTSVRLCVVVCKSVNVRVEKYEMFTVNGSQKLLFVLPSTFQMAVAERSESLSKKEKEQMKEVNKNVKELKR